jgi:hypothetical protein
MNRTFGIPEALQSLKPGAQWTLSGDNYSGLDWLDEEQTQPTEQECLAEAARLQADYNALEYQRLRAPEYPPITDYLDGVAKGNEDQINAYIAACLAVKEKYPKPV